MNSTNSMIPEAIQVANTLTAQSDRGLFLLTLVLLIGTFIIAIKWLVARAETSTSEYQKSLSSICREQNETMLKMIVCIDKNTSILHETAGELRRCREDRREDSAV